jgi:predicted nucleic acid-binding protein
MRKVISNTRTLGVVLKAKQSELIDEDIAIILSEFRQCGFRIPPNIEKEYGIKWEGE